MPSPKKGTAPKRAKAPAKKQGVGEKKAKNPNYTGFFAPRIFSPWFSDPVKRVKGKVRNRRKGSVMKRVGHDIRFMSREEADSALKKIWNGVPLSEIPKNLVDIAVKKKAVSSLTQDVPASASMGISKKIMLARVCGLAVFSAQQTRELKLIIQNSENSFNVRARHAKTKMNESQREERLIQIMQENIAPIIAKEKKEEHPSETTLKQAKEMASLLNSVRKRIRDAEKTLGGARFFRTSIGYFFKKLETEPHRLNNEETVVARALRMLLDKDLRSTLAKSDKVKGAQNAKSQKPIKFPLPLAALEAIKYETTKL